MTDSHAPTPRAASRSRRRALATAFALLLAAAVGLTGFAVLRAPVEDYVIEVGPLALPAGMDHHAMAKPQARAIALPFNGWFRGYAVDMIDGQGNPVPKALLHHVNLIAPERRELFSPIMLRLGAAGSETKPVQLPGLFGYRVYPGDSLLLTAMLHNPTEMSHDQVRIRVHLFYSPVGQWLRPFGIYPFYLDVMPPAGIHAYDLPPGHSEQSWEGRPAVAGRIIGVGGHLHEYAASLRLEDVTAKQVLWETPPVTDERGKVVGMPTKYFWPFGLRIDPAHTYRLTATYDNPTGDTIPAGGMGALGGAFLPDDLGAWPRVESGHPVYQHDLRVTYGGHEGGESGGPHHGGATGREPAASPEAGAHHHSDDAQAHTHTGTHPH